MLSIYMHMNWNKNNSNRSKNSSRIKGFHSNLGKKSIYYSLIANCF